MKWTKIITAVFIISLVVIYVLFSDGTLDPNKTEINEDVYLVKEHGYYSVYCDQCAKRFRSGTSDKRIATGIDSMIVSNKYGTIFHGYNNSTKKMEWFYIDVSPVKNVHHDFKDIRDATLSTMGQIYLDSIMTADEIWTKNSRQ